MGMFLPPIFLLLRNKDSRYVTQLPSTVVVHEPTPLVAFEDEKVPTTGAQCVARSTTELTEDGQ